MAADPIAAIQGELDNLAARRRTLEARKADAEATLVAARSARKNTLARDPTADLTGVTRAVRDGEEEVATIAGVLVDLADEQASVEARLMQAQDQAERAAAAKILEAVAISVDNAAADLEKALAAVGKAFASLVTAMPQTLIVAQIDSTGSKPTDLAAAVLAEGLARHCPAAMTVESIYPFHRADLRRVAGLAGRPTYKFSERRDTETVMNAVEASTTLISNRVRDRASQILAGKADAAIVDRVERAVIRETKAPESRGLVATENFTFRVEDDWPVSAHFIGDAFNAPHDVADILLAAGCVTEAGTPKAASAIAAAKRDPKATLARARDIGIMRRPVVAPRLITVAA